MKYLIKIQWRGSSYTSYFPGIDERAALKCAEKWGSRRGKVLSVEVVKFTEIFVNEINRALVI